jgi:hypothetical protein
MPSGEAEDGMIHGRQEKLSAERGWGTRSLRHVHRSLVFPAHTSEATMEFEIAWIDSRANKYEVIKAIATVLHSEEFFSSPDDSRPRPMNFEVSLEEPTVLGPLHNGRGKLCIPTKRDGQLFWNWLRLPKNKIRFGLCPSG